MPERVTNEELFALQEKTKQIQRIISDMRGGVRDKEQEQDRVIEEYKIKRMMRVKEEIEVRRMTWCTQCGNLVSRDQIELVLVKHQKIACYHQDSRDHGGSFLKLHRTCITCYEKLLNEHGSVRKYSEGEEIIIFYAFRAENFEDGYRARTFGAWFAIDANLCIFEELSQEAMERLANEWELPTKMELEYNRLQDPQLVIHELPAKTETAS